MKKKRRPRFIQRIYAWLHGYFWLPCPICGEKFGGHEWADSLMTSWCSGEGVCPDCTDEANRRNKKFMKNYPAPPVIQYPDRKGTRQ